MELITCSARAEITFPRVVNDLLIFAPSCNTQTNLVTLNWVQSTVRWLKHCTCQKRSQYLMDLDKTTFLFSRQPESPQMNCPALSLVGCPIEKCHAMHTLSLSPLAPVASALSLPARSTKLSLLTLKWEMHKTLYMTQTG